MLQYLTKSDKFPSIFGGSERLGSRTSYLRRRRKDRFQDVKGISRTTHQFVPDKRIANTIYRQKWKDRGTSNHSGSAAAFVCWSCSTATLAIQCDTPSRHAAHRMVTSGSLHTVAQWRAHIVQVVERSRVRRSTTSGYERTYTASLSLSHVICSLIIYDTMRCGYTEEMPSHLICYLSLSLSPVRYICRRICHYAVLTYRVNRSVTARNAIAFNTCGMGRAASTNINAREQGYRIHDFLLNELYLRCGSKRNSLGDGYYKRYHV